MSDVGKRLREERDKKHLTQVQVFTKTGINNKTLSGYENGVSHPDFETLKLLAELYGVTTDYLLGVDGEEHKGEETQLDKDKKYALELIMGIKDPDKKKAAIEYLKFLAGEK